MAKRPETSIHDQKPYDESQAPGGRGYYVITEPRQGAFLFPPHYHDDIEVFEIPGDFSGTVMVAGRHHAIERTMVFFVPPFAIHSFCLHCKGVRRFPLIKISVDLVITPLAVVSGQAPADVRRRLGKLPPLIVPRAGFRTAEIAERLTIYHDIRFGFEHSYPSRSLQKASGDIATLFEILTPLLARAEGQPLPPSSPTEPVRRVIDFIEEHFADPLTLTDIARASFLSKFHLCRVFKHHTGMSVRTFLNQVRVQHAQALLRQGEQSISETADRCGFASPSYFSKVFASLVGIPPRQWQRETAEDELQGE